ncbi:MAG TPA: ABC transporter permease [Acidimicrobiales bacterium]|nr:ABC transporter permease [Acidimicrobiales bacterium]
MSFQDLLPPGETLPSGGLLGAARLVLPETPPGEGSPSAWRATARQFLRSRTGMAGLVIIVIMVLFSFIGPLIYPTNQVATNILQLNLPPSSRFPLGTDAVGYNELGRLMAGGQPSLEVGIAAAAIAAIIGTVWGAAAGYVGGWVDAVMMRIVDGFVAIPTVLIVLLLASIVTPSVGTLIIVLGCVSWLITARLVRGEVLVLRTLDYVLAARMAGERPIRIVFRHLIRNVVGTVAVQATFEVANAILLLAALSFLGLGPPPPAANWGSMLTAGLEYIFDGYWWQVYPAGLCIVLTVVAFNLLGDSVRDLLEVRLQQQRGSS